MPNANEPAITAAIAWADNIYRELTISQATPRKPAERGVGTRSGKQPEQPPAPAVANSLPGRGRIDLPTQPAAPPCSTQRPRSISAGATPSNKANRAGHVAGAGAARRDAAVPVGDTQAVVAEPDKIKSAREVLSKIFAAFSTARDSKKGAAWRQLQRDLSTNAETLIMSGQITLPQMIDTMQKLEEYMGGSGEEDSGHDAAEIVGAWLRGEEPPSSEFDVDNSTPAAAK